MPEQLMQFPESGLVTGWDFSTGGVKCLAFDVHGNTVAEVRLPTDLYHGDPPEPGRVELSLYQLEGQARASTRAMAARMREIGRLDDWLAGGISATHHSSGRIDADGLQVRRAICWNDETLAKYHRIGMKRLGGPKAVEKILGGPWAIRYSLSHLVKDEKVLKEEDWKRTVRIAQHGTLAAGYLTGNFDVISVSAAASTGLMNFKTGRWVKKMLGALENKKYRSLAWKQLPRIIEQFEPIGQLAEHVALEAGIAAERSPWIFPTSDDQQAGLIGGGAVESGQLAIILGKSAVVNSSSTGIPSRGVLDVMRLNWGPYLWMRCYNNGAQFLDHVVGENPDWKRLDALGSKVKPRCDGTIVMPFLQFEPSLKVKSPRIEWLPEKPRSRGKQYRAALEAIAYLIALGVKEHERAGQRIERITVSGGMARSDLMCQILASVLNRSLYRLRSDEGPALGAAVTALAAMETKLRRNAGDETPYSIADAAAKMVGFRENPVNPDPKDVKAYREGLAEFRRRL